MKFFIVKSVWNYLSNPHMQDNFAREYQLEGEIHTISQENQYVQDFYFHISVLWDQLALT